MQLSFSAPRGILIRIENRKTGLAVNPLTEP
jgi:hypothetical protein